ncbi:hypothetical protein SAMN06265379_101413 [Saccharicrinis carchari]|uniref:Carboxypeptidase regulatory-like domain-containing protein n=2 Tax=Saccharicrinis carchari TaxID=1168039 RepID=A0A521AUG7_SACCC|nr:hypothetical protein SAMN06265379_101413 [Saccharicrinis carchari]
MLFVVLALSFLKGQEKYAVRGTVYLRDGKTSTISLLVSSDSNNIKVPVDKEGFFTINLSWDSNYQFYFSKPGYVAKKINFSTVVPGHVQKKQIYPYNLLVELFPTFPNADTSFFENPVAKIAYSPKINDFDYDLDYLLVVREKINSLNEQYQAYKRQVATKSDKQRAVLSQAHTRPLHHNQKQTAKKQEVETSAVSRRKTKELELPKTKNQFGLPPLKSVYPDGKSIEVYQLKGKVITRVIIKQSGLQRVFYKVEHNWGGLYFFVEESPSLYRSISKYYFESATKV